MADLVDRIHAWTSEKRHMRTLMRWGQTRTCPWCRQCVEEDGNHEMAVCTDCEMFDTYTCGNCGGKSAWEFGPVPMFRLLISPPVPRDDFMKTDTETRAILTSIKNPE